MRNAILLFTTLLFLTACGHMPSHDTSTADQPAQVRIIDAPVGAAVIVGNQHIGVVTKDNVTFSSPTGTQTVRVVDSYGSVLFEGTVFITKNITTDIPIQ